MVLSHLCRRNRDAKERDRERDGHRFRHKKIQILKGEENPMFYERWNECGGVSRKKRRSNNWLKQLKRLCRVYERIGRRRDASAVL